jgi:hypothetical protein
MSSDDIEPFDLSRRFFGRKGFIDDMFRGFDASTISLVVGSAQAIYGFASLLENATPPEQVAEIILKAVTPEHPEVRYLVSNDAATLMETRKTKY